MQNKYAGRCKCGREVAAGAGTVSKRRGKWVVACADCSTVAAPSVPQREMLGQIDWPNGMGYTECTTEYETAHHAALDARAAYEADETPENYEALCSAEYVRDQLQGAGGHLGRRVTFDKPDMITALMGGGKIAVRPGGACEIVTD